MKILYIANARIPTEKAHGRRIIKTCEALANVGEDVELWVPQRKKLVSYETDPFSFYGVLHTFEIHRFFAIDLLSITDGWPAVIDFFAYLILELSFVLAIFSTRRDKIVGKIVYSRSLLAAVTIKLLKGNRVFYECHDVGQNYLARKLYFFIISLLDGLVVVSVGLEKVFFAGGIARIAIIPASADIKEMNQINRKAARRSLKFGNRRAIVYTGRLIKSKGVYCLAETANKVTHRNKNVHFYFVGASTETDLKKLRQLSGDNNRTTFVGVVSPHESLVYQRASDILVLPGSGLYDNSREYTSPLKLFEYLATGVPIIATDVSANKAILTHKLNAYLVKPDDSDNLASGIEYLLKNKKLAQRISHQSLVDSRLYTWDQRANQIVQFIKTSTNSL